MLNEFHLFGIMTLMEKYAVIYLDKTRSPSPELVRDHVEFLKALEQRGKLFICGPMVDSEK